MAPHRGVQRQRWGSGISWRRVSSVSGPQGGEAPVSRPDAQLSMYSESKAASMSSVPFSGLGSSRPARVDQWVWSSSRIGSLCNRTNAPRAARFTCSASAANA